MTRHTPASTAKVFDREALKKSVEDIHAVYTPSPRLDAIKAGIIDLIGRSNRSSQGDIHVLIGPTRSGKSHLLDDLMHDYPRRLNGIQSGEGDFCDHVPVVISQVPNSTVKSVAEHIYRSISGMHPDQVLGSRYKLDQIVSEIIRLAIECGLKLLILDEAHQAIDQKTDRVALNVAVLIKDLVNAKVFSILVVGTENAMRLINANSEVQARTTRVYRLEPFGRSAEDRQDWSDVLGDVDDALASEVFGVRSGLTEPDMAEALLTGAVGIVGNMASLVEGGGVRALDDMIAGAERPGITWRHLETTFASWAPSIGRVNPFSEAARAPGAVVPPIADKGEDSSEGPLSGARGRRRSSHRDAQLRK